MSGLTNITRALGAWLTYVLDKLHHVHNLLPTLAAIFTVLAPHVTNKWRALIVGAIAVVRAIIGSKDPNNLSDVVRSSVYSRPKVLETPNPDGP